jgi:hypothetical protein
MNVNGAILRCLGDWAKFLKKVRLTKGALALNQGKSGPRHGDGILTNQNQDHGKRKIVLLNIWLTRQFPDDPTVKQKIMQSPRELAEMLNGYGGFHETNWVKSASSEAICRDNGATAAGDQPSDDDEY